MNSIIRVLPLRYWKYYLQNAENIGRWSFKEKSASLSLNKNRLMKMVKMGLAFLLAFASFTGIKAQTADEIVNKYVDAIGGKDKIQRVKTVYMENTSQVMGNEGPSTINIVNGTGYKLVSEMNGQTIIMVITDKGGWQVNPFAGATTPTALPDEIFKQSKGKLDAFGPLYNYAAKGNRVELQGKEGNAYKLKVTSPDSVEFTILIDTTTFYMTKLSTTANFMGQPIELTSTYSDFKKGDLGLVFPYSVEISYGGQFSVTTTVKKIELNKTVDPSIFVMPKS
jgi:outer membrane lipoprotein-sorting protein